MCRGKLTSPKNFLTFSWVWIRNFTYELTQRYGFTLVHPVPIIEQRKQNILKIKASPKHWDSTVTYLVYFLKTNKTKQTSKKVKLLELCSWTCLNLTKYVVLFTVREMLRGFTDTYPKKALQEDCWFLKLRFKLVMLEALWKCFPFLLSGTYCLLLA